MFCGHVRCCDVYDNDGVHAFDKHFFLNLEKKTPFNL